MTPLCEAEIVTTNFRLTGVVTILKSAIALPAGTVTVKGTAALAELLLDKLTTKPPVGAGAVSVTVPTERLPPRTIVGLSEIDESAAAGCGFTVKVVDFVTPL